jgi:hypothetical protein
MKREENARRNKADTHGRKEERSANNKIVFTSRRALLSILPLTREQRSF